MVFEGSLLLWLLWSAVALTSWFCCQWEESVGQISAEV